MAKRAAHLGTTNRTTVDPVCGMTVAVDGDIRTKRDGRPVVFCSTSCRDRFLADPDRYTDTPAPALSSQPDSDHACRGGHHAAGHDGVAAAAGGAGHEHPARAHTETGA
ncbi:MAG: YHS domain-containing protein, partial [Lapillicoccus sp.]